MGREIKPVIIDFGKSCQIAKAKFGKPILAINKAISRYPHIAPGIHRGERQSTASDVNVYSFGAMVKRLLKDEKFYIPALKEVERRCLTNNQANRPKLSEVLQD